jgi:hypothetical protein
LIDFIPNKSKSIFDKGVVENMPEITYNSSRMIGASVYNNYVSGNIADQVSHNARQQANQHIHFLSEQEQILAEAAAEIQQLLKQLEKTNPTPTEIQKIVYVNDETTPSFKRRVVGALQAGGESAIEEFLDNPYVNVTKAIVKGWIKPE